MSTAIAVYTGNLETTSVSNQQHKADNTDRLVRLGQISSVLAHHIRNPLAGIAGTAEVLLKTMDEDDPKRESIDVILEGAERLEKIIRNVLDYTHARPPSPTLVSAFDVLKKAIRKSEDAAARQAVDINVRCNVPDDPTQADVDFMTFDAMIDPEMTCQAFRNIISNALEAMPNAGVLDILISRPVDNSGSAPWLTVDFQDTGHGIPAEHIERIFDPFFTTTATGVGLGLTVAQQVVEDHGGRIDVHSEIGNGTLLRVWLPTGEQAALANDTE